MNPSLTSWWSSPLGLCTLGCQAYCLGLQMELVSVNQAARICSMIALMLVLVSWMHWRLREDRKSDPAHR